MEGRGREVDIGTCCSVLCLDARDLVKCGVAKCGMRKVKCGIENCGYECGMVGKTWNAENVN